jgi:hypothetical protein
MPHKRMFNPNEDGPEGPSSNDIVKLISYFWLPQSAPSDRSHRHYKGLSIRYPVTLQEVSEGPVTPS